MSIVAVVLFISLIILMFLGLPIAFSLGISALLALFTRGNLSAQLIPQRFFAAADSFTLLAVPFFVLAGQLMQSGGISKRLVAFANNIFGWMSGGLAQVSIAAAAFFAAISGSSAATTAAIGGVMYPEMVKRGYHNDFAAAVQAVGGTLGVVIPPSIPFIIYATQTGASVGNLFLAGIIPGLIGAACYMAVAYRFSKKEGYAKGQVVSLKEIWQSFLSAFWGLLTPFIILGGIYGGVFTPTEAAVVAVVYAVFVGRFVYKELDNRELYLAFQKAMLTSAMIMLLIVTASLFGWIMTIENVPQNVGRAVMTYAGNKFLFLLLVNLVFLVLGMFLDTIAILLLLVPIFYPIAAQLGINAVHFGVITVFNLAVGQMTPPFGVCLFVASGISNVSLERIIKRVVPFLAVALLLILLFTYVPWLTTWML